MSEPAWFHITFSTYGSWLWGDPRGFRTRHHREHVEGDYRNPPPAGLYEWRAEQSRASLKQPPVVFAPHWRQIVGQAVRDRLIELGAEVLTIAAGGQHCHVQAKMLPQHPRGWVGLAKKHAWFVARDAGWTGKMWAVRSRAERIKDRRHQINTYRYILDHRLEGAWTWSALE
jgi:hypothetical protein